MPNQIVTEAIDAVASGENLSIEQAQAVLREIMSGGVDEAQTATAPPCGALSNASARLSV